MVSGRSLNGKVEAKFVVIFIIFLNIELLIILKLLLLTWVGLSIISKKFVFKGCTLFGMNAIYYIL